MCVILVRQQKEPHNLLGASRCRFFADMCCCMCRLKMKLNATIMTGQHTGAPGDVRRALHGCAVPPRINTHASLLTRKKKINRNSSSRVSVCSCCRRCAALVHAPFTHNFLLYHAHTHGGLLWFLWPQHAITTHKHTCFLFVYCGRLNKSQNKNAFGFGSNVIYKFSPVTGTHCWLISWEHFHTLWCTLLYY